MAGFSRIREAEHGPELGPQGGARASGAPLGNINLRAKAPGDRIRAALLRLLTAANGTQERFVKPRIIAANGAAADPTVSWPDERIAETESATHASRVNNPRTSTRFAALSS